MINVPNPTESVLGGMRAALGVYNTMAQAQAAKAQREAQLQFQEDLSSLGPNPSPASLSQLMVKYPSMSEQLKTPYETLSAEDKQAKLNQATRVYSALNANKPDIAMKMLREDATAYRNSGREQDAKILEDLAQVIEINPETAITSTGLSLASIMGPEKFSETFGKLETERRAAMKAPFETTEARAKAEKAAVEARFAESNAVKDLEKKGWDIEKIKLDADIAKQNASIAALEQQLKKEELDYKKNEMKLKLIEKQEARDAAIREKTASVNQGTFAIDNMLNTVDKVLLNPELVDVIGPMEGKLEPEDMTAGFRLSDREADAIALINQLKSQAFVANVPLMKGLGTLTDAEGARLENLLGSLARTQSDEGFKESLAEIQRLLLKSRKMLAEKYGVPQPAMDTPAASARGAGMTIDQILEELGVGQ